MPSLREDSAGFTLIELLVVMIVLAALAAIAIPRFFGTKERALVATLQSDLRNLNTAQAAYFDDYQTFASDVDLLQDAFTASAQVTIVIDSATTTGWGATASHPSAGPVCTMAVSDAGSPPMTCAEP